MKIFTAVLGLMLVLLGAVASDSALAGRGHSARPKHFGNSGSVARFGHAHPRKHFRSRIFFAAPLVVAPLYFPRPGYYYAPAQPALPPEYMEQGIAPQEPVAQPYWYYCADSKTYYPYVSECPGGWQQVVPETPPPS